MCRLYSISLVKYKTHLPHNTTIETYFRKNKFPGCYPLFYEPGVYMHMQSIQRPFPALTGLNNYLVYLQSNKGWHLDDRGCFLIAWANIDNDLKPHQMYNSNWTCFSPLTAFYPSGWKVKRWNNHCNTIKWPFLIFTDTHQNYSVPSLLFPDWLYSNSFTSFQSCNAW